MNQKRRNRNLPTTVLALLLLLGTMLLSGCRSMGASAPMTEKDKQAFKGGPMPPEAREKMRERMRAISASPAAGSTAAKN